jgi:phosphatidylglycerophosphate synthase
LEINGPAMPIASETSAPGRPREIEAASNLYFVHPLSRALASTLATTPVTPNQVSVASVFASAAAAAAYAGLAWPWNAIVGLACQFVWHVLDGADGELARRTGRASPIGELIDGVCDHVSQLLIYVALAVMAQRTVGAWAWGIAVAAGASHFLQANAYETGRKAYRRFVYGAAWMRQTGSGARGIGAALGGLYMATSSLLSPGEAVVEAAMDGASTAAGRQAYRAAFAPLVKASGILGSNARTLATFLAVLAGRPLWFFLWELTALNLALAVLAVWRARTSARLARELA